MKRYQSAFAAPSGFVVSAGKAAKTAHHGDAIHRDAIHRDAIHRGAIHRGAELQGLASLATKARPIRDIRDRAA